MLTRSTISTLALAVSLAFVSSSTLAGEASERWNMSSARQANIELKATELGLSLIHI